MQISQSTLSQINNILAGNPSNYGAAYNLIIGDLAAQNLTLNANGQDVTTWLNVAYDVNSGSTTNALAIAVRATNQAAVFYETGRYIPLFGAEQQAASNAIALAFLTSVQSNQGTLPDFNTIQGFDVTQGLNSLGVSKAAWAGTVCRAKALHRF